MATVAEAEGRESGKPGRADGGPANHVDGSHMDCAGELRRPSMSVDASDSQALARGERMLVHADRSTHEVALVRTSHWQLFQQSANQSKSESARVAHWQLETP